MPQSAPVCRPLRRRARASHTQKGRVLGRAAHPGAYPHQIVLISVVDCSGPIKGSGEHGREGERASGSGENSTSSGSGVVKIGASVWGRLG